MEYEATIDDSLVKPSDVYKTFSPLRDKGREEMIAIYLTADLYVIAYDTISVGSKDTTAMYFDELLEGTILTRAKFFIILHNHPSGNAIPSKQDLYLMMQLQKYVEPLGRSMLDFMIIGHPKQKLPDGKPYWSQFEIAKGYSYAREVAKLEKKFRERFV